MENTIENYQKFICLYFGQIVLNFKDSSNNTYQVNVNNIWGKGFNSQLKSSWLSLTPLSKITDEDALNIAVIVGLLHDGKIESIVNWIESNISNRKINPDVIDYLRKKGYAVRYDGLSVEQQIEFGWIKLK